MDLTLMFTIASTVIITLLVKWLLDRFLTPKAPEDTQEYTPMYRRYDPKNDPINNIQDPAQRAEAAADYLARQGYRSQH